VRAAPVDPPEHRGRRLIIKAAESAAAAAEISNAGQVSKHQYYDYYRH